jgi:hypothetical protein
VLVFFQFCDVAEVAIIQDPKFSQIWLLTTSERKKTHHPYVFFGYLLEPCLAISTVILLKI